MTYALLAHINDGLSEIKDLSEVFKPLIMHCLSIYFKDGERHGTIADIQSIIKIEYALDMPIDFLKRQLLNMELELFNKYGFKINSESISCQKFKFDDFSEVMDRKNHELTEIENEFQQFTEQRNSIVDDNSNSIYSFIDHNREQFLNLLTGKKVGEISIQYIPHVLYIKSLQSIPKKMDCLREIFLGSLISCYFENSTESIISDNQIELVLDSNFIVSLLRLHPEESSNLCHRVFHLASNQGYKFTVLTQTIDEVKTLINNTADKIKKNNRNILGLTGIYDNDITKHCLFNEISPTQLMKTGSNLKKNLEKNFPSINYYDAKHFEEKAKNDVRYKMAIENQRKGRGKGEKAILHDMLATLYVENKRKKGVKKVNESNCWFLQSSNRDNHKMYKANGYVYEKIPSYFLLNILWLSSPSVDGDALDFAGACLTRTLSLTINQIKPSRSTIKIIEDTVSKNKDQFTDVDLQNLTRVVVYESELLRVIDDSSSEDKIIEVTKDAIAEYSTNEKKRSKVLKNAINDKNKAEDDFKSRKKQLILEKENEATKKELYKEKYDLSERLRELKPTIADADKKESQVKRNIKVQVRVNRFFCILVIIMIVLAVNETIIENWSKLEPLLWIIGIVSSIIPLLFPDILPQKYFNADYMFSNSESKYYKKYSRKNGYDHKSHESLINEYNETEEELKQLNNL